MDFSGFSAVLIGCVFLFSGMLKSLSSGAFFHHLDHLKLLPPRVNTTLGFLFIELEAGLGVALITGIFSPWAVQLAAGLLILFSAITLQTLRRSKSKRCGCYGEMIQISPKQSLLINFLLLGLVPLSWNAAAQNTEITSWSLVLVLFGIGIAGFFTKHSVQSPILDLSPIKVGKPWKKNWLAADQIFENNVPIMLVFIDQDDPPWLPVLGSLHQHTWKNRLHLIAPKNLFQSDGFESIKTKTSIPLWPMDSILFDALVKQSPLGVIVEKNVIRQKWHSDFPTEILEAADLDKLD